MLGLDAASVTDDDISALKTGIASLINGVSGSDIDNMVVTDSSYRRLGAASRPTSSSVPGRHRRLATQASVTFDVSLSIGSSTKYDDASEFKASVSSAIESTEDDSTDLVTEIRAAATSTTFDAVPTGSAVTSTSIVVLTRTPSLAPSMEPTAPLPWEPQAAGAGFGSSNVVYAIVGR